MLECIVCFGTNFTIEDGANVCLECGSHQVNFVDLIEDEDAWEVDKSRFFNTKQVIEKFKDSSKLAPNWTSFEAYNIILKSWTDALVHNGASEKFKDTVFRLWVYYLQKRKLAFVKENSEDTSDKPDFQIFTKRDMIVMKGAKLKEKETKKGRNKTPGSLEHIKHKVAGRQSRIKKTEKLTRYITNQMSETLNTFSLLEDEPDIKEDSKIIDQFDESQYESKPLLSDDEECEENNVPEDEAPEEEVKEDIFVHKRERYVVSEDQNIINVIASPTNLNLKKLLSIVYLALLIAEEDILLMDLMRWCREDFIPYHSAGYLLPKDKRFEAGDYRILNQTLPPAIEIRYYARNMAFYLSIENLLFPQFDKVVKKFVDALKLPDDFRVLIEWTLRRLLFSSSFQIPPLEAMVAATILLIFKVNYGMDDVHEEILSDYAETFNKVLKAEGKTYRLFSWREWHVYVNKAKTFTEKLNPFNWVHSKENPIQEPANSKRFTQHFWAKGIWRTPCACIDKNRKSNRSTWDSCLLNYTLGLNMKKLSDVVEEEPIFQAYKVPYSDLLYQYISGAHCMDKEGDDHMYKTAEELYVTNFASHRFNWILLRHEIIAEFRTFNKNINIVKVPLSDPKKAYESVSKSKKEEGITHFFVPDPLKGFWEIEDKTTADDLPKNFRWLMKILSQMCETWEYEIFKRYKYIEKRYLTVVIPPENRKWQVLSALEGDTLTELGINTVQNEN